MFTKSLGHVPQREPGVFPIGILGRHIDTIFSVGGLHLAALWKIFGSAGKW
jgi:hypothetical protein